MVPKKKMRQKKMRPRRQPSSTPQGDASSSMVDNGCDPIFTIIESGDLQKFIVVTTQDPKQFYAKAATLGLLSNGEFVPIQFTTLSFAVKHGRPAMVSHILETADLTQFNLEAVLVDAIEQFLLDKNDNIIKMLLQKGAPIDTQMSKKPHYSALHAAVFRGHTALVNHLIERKADVQLESDDGSPLAIAAIHNRRDIAETLMQLGASAAEPSTAAHRQTPLMTAAQCGSVEVLSLLLEERWGAKRGEVNQVALRGATALMSAIHDKELYHQNHPEIAQILIRAKADLEMREDFKERAAIHLALELSNLPLFSLLLDAKAEVNAKVRDGFTLLGVAASLGAEPYLQLLIQHKADLDQPSPTVPSLTIAIARGHFNCAGRLLDAKASVNLASSSGYTPLWICGTEQEDPIFFQRLIDTKAEIDIHNKDGVTLFRWLMVRRKDKNLRVLLENNVDLKSRNESIDDTLSWLAFWGCVESFKYLQKQHQLSIDTQDNLGYTCLMGASQEGEIEMVKYLLSLGANIDLKEYRCQGDALVLALARGHSEVATLLLGHKLNLALNDKGNSHAHLIEALSTRVIDQARWDVKRGAFVLRRSTSSRTFRRIPFKTFPRVVEYLAARSNSLHYLQGLNDQAFVELLVKCDRSRKEAEEKEVREKSQSIEDKISKIETDLKHEESLQSMTVSRMCEDLEKHLDGINKRADELNVSLKMSVEFLDSTLGDNVFQSKPKQRTQFHSEALQQQQKLGDLQVTADRLSQEMVDLREKAELGLLSLLENIRERFNNEDIEGAQKLLPLSCDPELQSYNKKFESLRLTVLRIPTELQAIEDIIQKQRQIEDEALQRYLTEKNKNEEAKKLQEQQTASEQAEALRLQETQQQDRKNQEEILQKRREAFLRRKEERRVAFETKLKADNKRKEELRRATAKEEEEESTSSHSWYRESVHYRVPRRMTLDRKGEVTLATQLNEELSTLNQLLNLINGRSQQSSSPNRLSMERDALFGVCARIMEVIEDTGQGIGMLTPAMAGEIRDKFYHAISFWSEYNKDTPDENVRLHQEFVSLFTALYSYVATDRSSILAGTIQANTFFKQIQTCHIPETPTEQEVRRQHISATVNIQQYERDKALVDPLILLHAKGFNEGRRGCFAKAIKVLYSELFERKRREYLKEITVGIQYRHLQAIRTTDTVFQQECSNGMMLHQYAQSRQMDEGVIAALRSPVPASDLEDEKKFPALKGGPSSSLRKDSTGFKK